MKSNLYEKLRQLSPEEKVQALEAMGFVRTRASHLMSCVSIQGSGYICTCTAPSSRWIGPEDVKEFLGESDEQRHAYTARRNAYEDDGQGDPVEGWAI